MGILLSIRKVMLTFLIDKIHCTQIYFINLAQNKLTESQREKLKLLQILRLSDLFSIRKVVLTFLLKEQDYQTFAVQQSYAILYLFQNLLDKLCSNFFNTTPQPVIIKNVSSIFFFLCQIFIQLCFPCLITSYVEQNYSCTWQNFRNFFGSAKV